MIAYARYSHYDVVSMVKYFANNNVLGKINMIPLLQKLNKKSRSSTTIFVLFIKKVYIIHLLIYTEVSCNWNNSLKATIFVSHWHKALIILLTEYQLLYAPGG